MGLRINEINNNESYEIKPYTSSKNENSNASENNFASYGVVYEHNTDKTLESCVYTKEQVMAARSSVENKQFQNNLKILGFLLKYYKENKYMVKETYKKAMH